MSSKTTKAPESIAHREFGVADDHVAWCREVVNFDDRQDSVPSLNGVTVGQRWRNIHQGQIKTVTDIRLAGLGTHTAHYESVLLVGDGDEEKSFFDISGWSLWSLHEHWEEVDQDGKRIEPQPIIWFDRSEVNEDRFVSRVRHDRPQGESIGWRGERRTAWRLYDNDVLTCDGIVIGKVYGEREKVDEVLLQRWPLCAPGPTAARKDVFETAVSGLALRWKESRKELSENLSEAALV